MAKNIISNKFITSCMSIQLYVHVVLHINVSILHRITSDELYDWESAPYEHTK